MSETGRLLTWFRSNARGLPWRTETRDPYGVLVSEVMLQQTQVDRVVPRFEAFMAAFPSLEALAAAAEDDVLERWSGLGYYRRARLLHRLAREVIRGSGRLPESAVELEKLPGVGRYTAAAVASLAFGEPVAVVDGNVNRVAARVLAMADDPRTVGGRRRIVDWIGSVMAGADPGAVNEALMELGATVCLPAGPDCAVCPLSPGCRARAAGNPERYPPPRKRRAPVDLEWVAACCIDHRGRWLAREVSEGPILRGLWLPPLAELTGDLPAIEVAVELVPMPLVENPVPLPVVRHSITHRRIRVHPIRLVVASPGDDGPLGRWVDPESSGVPTSSLFMKLIRINRLSPRDLTE
jgi:A/G-specific adenine glycosylase